MRRAQRKTLQLLLRLPGLLLRTCCAAAGRSFRSGACELQDPLSVYSDQTPAPTHLLLTQAAWLLQRFRLCLCWFFSGKSPSGPLQNARRTRALQIRVRGVRSLGAMFALRRQPCVCVIAIQA